MVEIVRHPEPGHVYVKGEIRSTTEKAILFQVALKLGLKTTYVASWVPISQIKDDDVDGKYARGKMAELLLPDWVVDKKGFV